MKVGNIIKNKSIKNRYSGKNLIGIVTKVSAKKCRYWVIDLESGSQYIWLSRECEIICK